MNTENRYRWLNYFIPCLTFAWFVYLGASNRPAEVVSRFGHGWPPTLILVVLIIVSHIGSDGAEMTSTGPRILLIGFVLVAILLLPIALMLHPIINFTLLGLFCLEQYWLKHRKKPQSSHEP
jgi:hypothetical protein